MNDMLNGALVSGTGKRAAIPLHAAAGKTGTTQSFRDAWFIGYTAHLTTGVWTGNDDGSAMNRVVGGSLPAEIWREIMTRAHTGRQPLPLSGAEPATAHVPRSRPIRRIASVTTSSPARSATAQAPPAPSSSSSRNNRPHCQKRHPACRGPTLTARPRRASLRAANATLYDTAGRRLGLGPRDKPEDDSGVTRSARRIFSRRAARTGRSGAGRGRRPAASACPLSSWEAAARRAPRNAGRGSSRRGERPRERRRNRGCAAAPG